MVFHAPSKFEVEKRIEEKTTVWARKAASYEIQYSAKSATDKFTKLGQAARISRYDSRQNFQLRPGKAPPILDMNYDLYTEVQKSRMRAQQLFADANTMS